MTSDAYGFGQLNKEISFQILYAQLLTKNAGMASVENGKTCNINADKQIDQKEDARSKREVTLTQNNEMHESLWHVVSNCVEKKKAYNAFLKDLINNAKKAL